MPKLKLNGLSGILNVIDLLDQDSRDYRQ